MFGKIDRGTGRLMDNRRYKGGGGDTQKSTTSSDPWSGLQPYLTDYLSKGQALTNQPYNFNNGDQVAGFSPEQQLGFNLSTQRALAGSPTLNAANNNITNTLNGNYLSPDSNPWLKSNVDQALNDVTGRVNSQFNNSNFGSSANQETLQRDLGSTASQMYGQNYTNERNNQLQAANLAPGLANADYLDSSMLQNVGAQRQGLAQNYLNQANNTFQGAANWPYTQLQRYGQVISGASGQGGTSTTTSPNPYQQNGFGNLLGLGLTAASLFI